MWRPRSRLADRVGPATKVLFALLVTLLVFGGVGAITTASAQDHPDPYFIASLDGDWVFGDRFTGSGLVSLDISDGAGGAVLFSGSQPADGSGYVRWEWDDHQVDLVPGLYVKLTDQTTGVSRDLVLDAITIDGVDRDANTAWGTAPASRQVSVRGQRFDGGVLVEDFTVDVTSDPSGYWFVDTDDAGIDLLPETQLHINVQGINGGAATNTDWQEPAPPSQPVVHASLTNKWVSGYGFTPDSSVTVEFFDSVGGSPVGTPAILFTDGSGYVQTFAHEHGVSLVPGMYLVVTDDTTGSAKSLELEPVAITGVNYDADAVMGRAPAFRTLTLYGDLVGGGAELEIQSGPDGTWYGDFATVGFDLAIGDLQAHLADDDGDLTIAEWRPPSFLVRPPNPFNTWQLNHVHGFDWPDGATVTLTVDDPSNGPGVDYLDSALVEPAPDRSFVEFTVPESALIFAAGQTVTLSDGFTTKTHVVTDLMVTGLDADSDVVSGVAASNSQFFLAVDGQWLDVVADIDGNWTIDLSLAGSPAIDLVAGSEVEAKQYDEDGDETSISTRIESAPPVPNFWVGHRGVSGWGFEASSSVTITFSDGGNEWVTYATTDETGTFSKEFESADWHILPGHEITVNDGTTVKSHTLTNLAVTTVDPGSDTISGTADPAFPVTATGGDGSPPLRTVPVDGTGLWTADFSVACSPGDEGCEGDPADVLLDAAILGQQGDHWGCVVNGGTGCPPLPDGLTGGAALQCDGDGDCTIVGWPIGEGIEVWLENNIWGGQWSEGSLVTVEVDLGADGLVDYTEAVTSQVFGGEVGAAFSFEESGLLLSAGDHIVMYDGRTTKELYLPDLAIDWVDAHEDLVFGRSAPGAEVTVGASTCVDDVCEGGWRIAHADDDGNWVADFTTPFLYMDPVDIRPGSEAEARLYDADLDTRKVSAVATDPVFGVDPDTDVIWGNEWRPDSALAVEVDTDSDPGNGVLHSAMVATDGGGHFELDLTGVLDVQADHQVRVAWKGHQVTGVSVTNVDPASDTISGSAEPGSEVVVRLQEERQVWQHLTFQFGPGRLAANPDSLNEHLKFRQAVAHAIDREALVAGMGAGDAIDSYIDAYLPELSQHGWAQYDYDPIRARQLLDELCSELNRDCSTDPPIAFFNWYPSNWRVVLADVLRPMFEAVGIEVVIDLDPDFWSTGFGAGEFDIGEWGWLAEPTLTELTRLHDWWDPREVFESNPYGWGTTGSSVINDSTDRMAELVGLMHSTGNDALLTTYIQEAELILADQVMFIPLYSQPWIVDGPYRVVTADASGNWTADFSVPWGDEPAFDVQTGAEGHVRQYDDDGDFTHRDWHLFEVLSVDSAVDPLPVGTDVGASGLLSNPLEAGVLASWDWGDGTTTSGTVAGDTVSGSHAYTEPGVYEVRLDATDDRGNGANGTYRYVVVYDPSAGFATGGGWFIPGGSSSDPGDLLPGLDGSSKANFGFVVKYQTGASTVPGGNLEFHYNVGGFHLHSTGMEWLVVTNNNWAKFQGIARIDGTNPQYPFRVDTRDDDDHLGDRFIIKVWAPDADPDREDPIYKASGDLGGGQVTIHR